MTARSRARDIHKVTYLYRDAGNYKFWGEFYIEGQLTQDELRPHLLRSEYFVPERVGIPSLVPLQMNGDDHLLHEIDSITPSGSAPYVATADELLERFRAASGHWFQASDEPWL